MITSPEPVNENRSWKVTTEPEIEPISVTELKTFARIDGDAEDTLLTDMIQAVRESMEFYLGRALIEQELTFSMDYWPSNVIELPSPPLLSITSVYVVDEDDEETAFGASNYYAVTEAIPGKLALSNDSTGPTNTDRDTAGFIIKFKAGYGSQASNVPAAIRLALQQWAAMVYDDRALTTEPPDSIKRSLSLFRARRVI